MEIVLMYKDSGKEYIVYKQDDKFFGCINRDGEFDYDLNSEERKILDHIFKNLCFNSNSEKIATIEFDNELTNIYYDKEKDLYNFKLQSSKELTKEQLTALNKMFNNRDNVVYFKIKETEYIKRFVKSGKKKILVFLSAAMILQTGMTLNVQASYNETPNIEEIEIFNIDDYAPKKSLLETESFGMSDEEKQERINTLKDSIKNNPNLSEEEIRDILSYFSIIEDNIEYINFDYINDLYKNKLDIIYNNNANGNVEGSFYPDDGRIILYSAESIQDHEAVFSHELSHTTENNKRDFALSNFFEALNAIYNSEYFGYDIYDFNYHTYDNSYETYKPYIYVLAEIIRPEALRRYHFTQDTESLIKEMMTILPSREKCYSILYGISNASPIKDRNTYLVSLLKEMYYIEYGQDLENNIEVMARLDNKKLSSYVSIEDEYEVNSQKIIVKTQKAYFNEKNPYYMIPSSFALQREVKNYVQMMTIDEALSMGLAKLENHNLILLNDAYLIDDNTVGYNAPFGTVENTIDIKDFYNEHSKTK